MTTEPSSDDLQFDTAEPTTPVPPPSMTCAACHRPVGPNYFSVGNAVLCPDCIAAVQGPAAGGGFGRFVLAATYGLVAAIAGAVVFYAVAQLLNATVGIVSVAVGFMVAKAVRRGSGNRGGIGYQLLAVMLTYLGIAMSFLPMVMSAHLKHPHTVLFLVILRTGSTLIAPVLVARRLPITGLIYCFALWEAWKLTAARRLPINGPYPTSGFPIQPIARPPGGGPV